jgi:hypothetical protein
MIMQSTLPFFAFCRYYGLDYCARCAFVKLDAQGLGVLDPKTQCSLKLLKVEGSSELNAVFVESLSYWHLNLHLAQIAVLVIGHRH